MYKAFPILGLPGACDDGCSLSCQVECGYVCSLFPGANLTTSLGSTCQTVCGDGLLAGTETCDDGNADDDDGNLASGSGAFSSRSRPSHKAPSVAPTSAGGAAFSNIDEELQKCNSVRDVNALYTRLSGQRDLTPDEIDKMRKRKEELK